MDANINQNTVLRAVNEGMLGGIRKTFGEDVVEREKMEQLAGILMKDGKEEETKRAICNEDYRQALFEKYHI